ncbi:rhodanese-like domain-containing protein [Pseudosulfitobacter koreensis]|uniref:Rhodanese-like domain-containing protein n=1 Tax=Pseudosulfitobacter koreensis TaxID=2968472 RepID=A0ABT1Z2T5_9RHOB|nr:rhodanese-like domain-containing protein [Pseudosulfitobacter koreense]MCR8827456.1 rhodanese-like domain-containing protein [Pseudosulfitobacter koreense]
MAHTTSLWSRRRIIGLGAAAALTGGAVYGGRWYNVAAQNGTGTLTPLQAHAGVQDGTLLLIDIRRPDEWALTGIGQGAHPLDMRNVDFMAALRSLAQARGLPVAVICARGVRSRFVTRQMQAAGLAPVTDVPEGILGSGAGPGWIKRGLPLARV